jgi:isopentenyl diphosphate isomerase/L-lactate dehydrogenase-like FMN-dependent dehydrogenase
MRGRGSRQNLPVGIAPMGGLVLFHPEGDVEMARGAGKADILQWLSGKAGCAARPLRHRPARSPRARRDDQNPRWRNWPGSSRSSR